MEKREASNTFDRVYHNIPETVELNELISRLNDPFDKVLIMEMLIRDKDLDISKTLYLNKTDPNISSEDMVLRALEGKPEREKEFFHRVFYNTTLYGKNYLDQDNHMDDIIDALLLLANRSLHCGDISLARDLYKGIIEEGGTDSQMILSKI
ncbi:MAG: hypothetical protein JXA22_04900 [Candidatus Thermoplasmatota archaeon]|nr:hypothetical protein [Candidatus Thermoplasmatota archaeon]